MNEEHYEEIRRQLDDIDEKISYLPTKFAFVILAIGGGAIIGSWVTSLF